MRRRAVSSLIAVALAAFLAACSDGGDDAASSTSTSISADPATTAPEQDQDPLAPPTSRARETTTTTAAPSLLPCEDPRPSAEPTYPIEARDHVFEPSCLALSVDQGVNVVNAGTVVHNVTLQRVTDAGRTEIIDFGNLEPGQNTATEAFGNQGPGGGVFRLYCKIHESAGMEAFLEVT